MVKKFFIFAVCIMLSATSISAQRTTFIEYGNVEISVADAPRGDYSRFKFGLCKDGKEILPAVYNIAEGYPVELFAFFKDTEILVYDTDGNLVDEAVLDFPVDHRTAADFEMIGSRLGENIYELVVYYNDNDWIYQSVGAYCRKGEHLYKVRITKEFTLIE